MVPLTGSFAVVDFAGAATQVVDTAVNPSLGSAAPDPHTAAAVLQLAAATAGSWFICGKSLIYPPPPTLTNWSGDSIFVCTTWCWCVCEGLGHSSGFNVPTAGEDALKNEAFKNTPKTSRCGAQTGAATKAVVAAATMRRTQLQAPQQQVLPRHRNLGFLGAGEIA